MADAGKDVERRQRGRWEGRGGADGREPHLQHLRDRFLLDLRGHEELVGGQALCDALINPWGVVVGRRVSEKEVCAESGLERSVCDVDKDEDKRVPAERAVHTKTRERIVLHVVQRCSFSLSGFAFVFVFVFEAHTAARQEASVRGHIPQCTACTVRRVASVDAVRHDTPCKRSRGLWGNF